MLIASIGLVLAGLVAVGFGIPVKEFGFGNTLIVTGVVGACTGMIMLGLWAAVRELKNIARRLDSGMAAESGLEFAGRRAPAPGNTQSGESGLLFTRDQEAIGQPGVAGGPAHPASIAPWHDETASRGRHDAPGPEPAEPPVPKRRNLLFSSTSRKERERAEARSGEPPPPDLLASDLRSDLLPEPSPSNQMSPVNFDDTWPKLDLPRPDVPPRRRVRTPSTFTAADTAGPDRYPAADEEPAAVTVLKSGVVDGMAYSLYSDGSIEAQMPEGMMRFGSLDELRAHLEHRP
jgi:hypothetical protein